jgi:DNA-binding protein H-NS
MENIYLQIIQLWLFIQALMNEKEKQMAQPPETMTERGGLNLEILDGDERVKLIGEICQELTVQQLKQVRELADQKRLEKIDEAKEQVIARMREEFAQLDLDLDEVMGLSRGRRRKSPLPPKYRSPEGKEWSGRGYAPVWIREYEEAGGDREDYFIKDEA